MGLYWPSKSDYYHTVGAYLEWALDSENGSRQVVFCLWLHGVHTETQHSPRSIQVAR